MGISFWERDTMHYYAHLIRRERLQHNWSQQGLCRGICAVSYLSKIERGQVMPSQEVLQQLLARLQLPLDEALQQRARALAEAGYELLFDGDEQGLQTLLTGVELPGLRACSAYPDLQLLSAIQCGGAPLPAEEEAYLQPQAMALQAVLRGDMARAVALLPNAWCYWQAGMAAYQAGHYASALEALQRGYDLAAAQGRVRLMLLCSVYCGNCYCNRQDLPRMQQHYAVARRLAQALGRQDMLEAMAYNTAAVQVETGDYAAAYGHLAAIKEPGPMALHKLAICCEKLGRPGEALAALEQAEGMQGDFLPQDITRRLCAPVRYRITHADYLQQPAYGALLQEAFDCCRADLPAGYAVFHLPWMLEWYQSTRQYKKALALLRDFHQADH